MFVLVAAMLLTACAAAKPDVTKSVTIDDKGRTVTHYRICEKQGVLWGGKTVCRTESIVHNYCYRSLGHVDCYERPQEGRTVMRVQP